jgi:hypothetical protein
MKLTITRLRRGTNYKKPLHDIMDSFYELYKEYILKNSQHTYGVCNFGWGTANRRKLDDIIDADVIIIPSENEFLEHIIGYRDPVQRERSEVLTKQIIEYLPKKHVVLVRSDRADNEELYRTRTFKNKPIGKFSTFDEMDLPGGLHGMKYHFIKENISTQLFKTKKEYDFIYWGCDKKKLIDDIDSGDERHLVFKQIKEDNKIKSYFIGKYNSFKADRKIDTMYNLLGDLTKAKSTLCFNWLDPKATTSRYHEAIALGIFPFVWKNYDSNNTLVADQWQRVESIEELYNKIPEVNKRFDKIEKYYIEKTMKPKLWYYEKFEKRMNEILKGNQ